MWSGVHLSFVVMRIMYKDVPFSVEGHVLCPEYPTWLMCVLSSWEMTLSLHGVFSAYAGKGQPLFRGKPDATKLGPLSI